MKKVVHTSSIAVFGVPKRNPVTEETAPTPMEAYGKAKLAGEQLAIAAAWPVFEARFASALPRR